MGFATTMRAALTSHEPTNRAKRRSSRFRVSPLVVGGFLALATLSLGPLTIPAIVALVLLPWFLSEPLRLYVLLLVTWPVATLYVNIPLPAGIPDLRYERLVVLAIIGILVVGSLAGKRSLTGVPISVAVLVGLQLAWYFYHAASGGVADAGLSILISSTVLPVSLYWLTRELITDRAAMQVLLKTLLVVGLIVAFTGFYERMLGGVYSPFPVETGTASGARYLGVPGGRAAGVFGNPAIYGAVLAAALLAARALFVETRHRVMVGLAGLVLGYGVFVSYTRSAWLAAVAAGLVAILVTTDVIRQLGRLLAAAAVLGIVVIALLPGLIGQNEALRDRILETDNVSGRIDRALYSWNLFLENAATGLGPDSLDKSIAFEFASEGKGFTSSHNTYLTMLVDGGAAVFAAAIAVFTSFMVGAYRVYRATSPGSPARYALAAMLGTIVAVVTSGMALELKYFAFFNSLYWIAGATIANLIAMSRDDPGFRAPIPQSVDGVTSMA